MHVTPAARPLALTLFTPLDASPTVSRPEGRYDPQQQITLDEQGEPLSSYVMEGTTMASLSPTVVSCGEGEDEEEIGAGW
ncbi:hypothetical protein [Streptomyces spectabilis]|uniref:Putative ATP-grasp target RiPP n=1 Tax=Streptomyces spectabilis TaxID=68270 RepID=A0A7W8EZB8_STRST|nr:hypothetical protein [Streptomyces spectabilis]MBB5108989.1 putative ATP-grasp target RiPP [Streptomyces spectabilis]GGV50531.1 hypothetical protein GCM10010245_79620 [Streptomyces spectabilis]